MNREYRSCLVVAGLVLALGVAAAAELPQLRVELGERNEGTGLVVPSGGDGVNVAAAVGGVACRRIEGESAHYLYVRIEDPVWTNGPVDAYVTVEALDDRSGRVAVDYDRAAAKPDIGSKYHAADGLMLLTESGGWVRGVFPLPDLRLGHGQNHGADFRILGRGLSIRRITLSSRPPAGWDATRPVQEEQLRRLAVRRPPGMELTFGNDATPAEAALFKALSVGSVESYVDWAGVEPAEGKWDWSKWDRQVKVLQDAGLKWVPFLIAGPAYATPLWFQNGPESQFCRCLEHGQDSRIQSLFNPHLRARVERFVQAFADRYRDTGVVESILLGVSGTYGESIYAAGPPGGWTTKLTGDYHNHAGWWADEPPAVEAFRAAMKTRYGTIAALNAAWGADHASFDALRPALPRRLPNDRARADAAEWYQQAMTDWSVFWVGATRRAFPNTPIYLCTGGDGRPELGADFTAQAAAIAPAGAGIRITNEGSAYDHNFTLTREVATSTRLYGTFCGFEPASQVDAAGIVARIYNASASGARQLHDYTPNTLGPGITALPAFRAAAPMLVPRRPRVEAALYLSRETWALAPDAIERAYGLARTLRDAVDLDFVTRRSVADGALKDVRVLVLAESEVLEPVAARAIEAWVEAGGLLLTLGTPGTRLYDQAEWRVRMLAPAPVPVASVLAPRLQAAPPARWTLAVGGAGDAPWLSGDWNGCEAGGAWRDIPGATMRWSGRSPAVWLPMGAGASSTLKLSVWMPAYALGPGGVTVRVDGKTVGVMDQAGLRDWSFPLPPRAAGDVRTPLRLEFAVAGWRPMDVDKNSRDDRTLGFQLRQVELVREGAETAAPTEVAVRVEADDARLAAAVRPVGRGRSLWLTNGMDATNQTAVVLASLLPGTPDGRVDGRFATLTDAGVVWFEQKTGRMWVEDAGSLGK